MSVALKRAPMGRSTRPRRQFHAAQGIPHIFPATSRTVARLPNVPRNPGRHRGRRQPRRNRAMDQSIVGLRSGCRAAAAAPSGEIIVRPSSVARRHQRDHSEGRVIVITQLVRNLTRCDSFRLNTVPGARREPGRRIRSLVVQRHAEMQIRAAFEIDDAGEAGHLAREFRHGEPGARAPGARGLLPGEMRDGLIVRRVLQLRGDVVELELRGGNRLHELAGDHRLFG